MTSKVRLVSQLHREAMEFTDESFIARGLDEYDEYIRLTKLAYAKEKEAADLLSDVDVEPTRSILHRSAATLAFRCEMYSEAKRLVHRALAGHPPSDIEYELNDLLGMVKIAVAGIHLLENQVQLTLEGRDIAFGKAPTASVISRIRDMRDLIQISANFDIPVYFDAVGAGSFYVNLTVGKPYQPSLPGFSDASDSIGPFMENLALIDQGEYQPLLNKFEDPAEYRSFVRAARRLAPDGRQISYVNVQARIGDRIQSVFLKRSQEELKEIPVPDIPKENVIYSLTEKTVKQTGVLKVADARDNSECILVSESFRPWTVEIPEELMNEVLGDFFNKRVEVKGKQMRLSRAVRRIHLERKDDIRLLHGNLG